MDLLFLARSLKVGASWYFADLLLGLSGAVWAFLLAERFDGIGVWSKHQVVFLLGLALLVRGVIDVGFSMNVSFPSRRIGRGQLDHAADAAPALAHDRRGRLHAVLGLGNFAGAGVLA
jgi:hypothetical protein